MSTTEKDDKPTSIPNFPQFDVDWDWYTANRGNYPPEHILDLARQYHRENAVVEDDPAWEKAIDVGAGTGLFGVQLLRDYNHVVLCEPDSDHLKEAERRHCTDTRISLLCSRAEDILENTKPGSADLICVANSINFMEPAKSIGNFYEVLAPGGTLLISQYGDMPFFSDHQPYITTESGLSVEAAQVEFDVLLVETMSERIKEMRDSFGEAADYALALLRSRLDALEFSADNWTSIQRHHWYKNRDVIPPEGLHDRPIPALALNVKDKDWVMKSKENLMYIDVDFAWICSYMHKEGLLLQHHTFEEELAHLKQVMGDVKWRLAWPYDLTLATKKGQEACIRCTETTNEILP